MSEKELRADASDKELRGIFRLFSDKMPLSFDTVETGKSETDYRCAVTVTAEDGEKLVIKLSDNDFTSPERIRVWQRLSREYNCLGCYSPAIYADKEGCFPYVSYKGRRCIAYAEEFARYRILQSRDEEDGRETEDIFRAKWELTAKVAAKGFDFCPFPSGYCLFERFCPSDLTDEVTEQAEEWKAQADRLPERFKEQTERIRGLWLQNRAELEKVYHRLPASVFQADLNPTNLLVDDSGSFAGLFDYNLSGREVFLNYLFRECFCRDFEQEIEQIRKVIGIASRHYEFSREERDCALMLYRCLKPIRKGFEIEELLQQGAEEEKIARHLDLCERYMTEDIGFFD